MLDNFNSKQKIVLGLVTIVIVLGVIYYIYNNTEKKQIDLNQEILVKNIVSEEKVEDNLIVVHITGSVKTPGIVKLKEGARIEDAIIASGGLTEDADISKVNLAYILEDGIKLKIPSSLEEDTSEEKEFVSNDSGENIIEENQTNLKDRGNININKATQLDFEELPGIGPSLAKKIIEYREQTGNFQNIEDIKNVSGIGNSKFEEIKKYIYVK